MMNPMDAWRPSVVSRKQMMEERGLATQGEGSGHEAVQQHPSGWMAKGKTICAPWPVPDHSLMGWWIVWACAEEESHVAIGSRPGISTMTVGKWRRRYLEQGIEGWEEEERPGGPRTHDAERVAEMSNTALHSKPPQGTDWIGASVPWRSMGHLQIHGTSLVEDVWCTTASSASLQDLKRSFLCGESA